MNDGVYFGENGMDLNIHEKNLIPLWICVEIAICNKKNQ